MHKQIARREEGFSLYFAGANKERGPKAPRQTVDFRQPQSSVKTKRMFVRTQPISVPHSEPKDNPPLNKWQMRIREPASSQTESSVPDVKVVPPVETKSIEAEVPVDNKPLIGETASGAFKNHSETKSVSVTLSVETQLHLATYFPSRAERSIA